SSTGKISVQVRSRTGYKVAPVADIVSPGSRSCNTDVGRGFVFGTANAGQGVIGLINYGASNTTGVTVSPVSGSPLHTYFPAAGYFSGVGAQPANVYVASADVPVAVWSGNTYAPFFGSLSELGDDIEQHLGADGATRILVVQQSRPTIIFT